MLLRKLTSSNRASPKRRLVRLLVLLALAVLVPSVALLWLLDRALTSERVALEQQFRMLCLDHLDSAIGRWDQRWHEAEVHWSESASINELLNDSLFAAALQVDPESGLVVYPVLKDRNLSSSPRNHPSWGQARWLELNDKGYAAAQKLYASIEASGTSIEETRAAWQGRVRCLVKDGHPHEALSLWREAAANSGDHRELWETALYLSGEAIDSNAALELRQGVRDWLTDETRSARHLPLGKRLFMMDVLEQAKVECPTRRSEQRLATLRNFEWPAKSLTLTPADDGLWAMLSLDRRSVVLIDQASVTEIIAGATGQPLPITINPPGEEIDALVDRRLSGPLGGWQLAIAPSAGRNPVPVRRQPGSSFLVWGAWLALAASAMVAAWLCRAIFQEAKLNRLKNDFLAAVSHELKTPVTAIGLLVENLERKGLADPEETSDYLALISRENDRLRRLIDNFLSFSRMERQKHHFTREPVSLDEIMSEAVAAVRERHPDASQKIIEAPTMGPLYLEGDREALATVLVNLIDNALKYSSEDVRLDLSAGKEQIAISISDRGIGMSAEERSQAFDKFYRADPSLTNEAPGVGLGLSIVDFVVRAHHGNVTVDSEPGQGSRFTVHLPLSPS